MKRLPAIDVPERFDDSAKAWAYRLGTLSYQSTVDDVAMLVSAAQEESLAPVRRQLLAVLVRDFGYSAEPMYGHTPIRHQFAWREAVSGMAPEQLEATVSQMLRDEAMEREAERVVTTAASAAQKD